MASVADLELAPDDLAAALAAVRDAARRRDPDAELPLGLQAAEPETFDSRKTFLTRLKDILKGKVDPGEFDDAVKRARGHAGGKGKAAKRRTAAELAEAINGYGWEPFAFAEGSDTLFVALWLSPDAAQALAVDGGEPAEALHVTLCIVPGIDAADHLAMARALVAIDEVAQWFPPVEGKVGGAGRFYASTTSDGLDAFWASPDVPGLAELRARICEALGWRGFEPSRDHGYTPHITLAYLEAGAPDPVDALPETPLRFDAITVAWGDRMATVPLSGDPRMVGERVAFAEPTDLTKVCDVGSGGYRLFTELRAYAEAPEWIQFLPAPGTFKHPAYGEIALTRERAERFVANFRDGVYQEHIPIDAEHQTKVSGAVAWIADVRLNNDGSIDVKPEWTDRGVALLESDRFKYFSPEWFDAWEDPATGKIHRDVIAGGAICTRPFFKDGHLRPLVAHEDGRLVERSRDFPQEDGTVRVFEVELRPANPADAVDPAVSREGDGRMANDSKPNDQQTPPAGAPLGMTEEQAKAFSELQDEVRALTEANQAAQTEAKQARERADKLETDARRKRFTDEVMGRSDDSHLRWFGEVEGHVTHLEDLAKAFGEDSEQVKHYVAQNRAHAEQLKGSNLFAEIGSDAPGGEKSAEAAIESAAKACMEKDPKLTHEQAVAKALSENPSLYKAYTAAQG